MSNFIDNLRDILTDLNNHKNGGAKLIEHYIEKRLNESLASYYDSLSKSISYLNSKDELNVLKKMNKD